MDRADHDNDVDLMVAVANDARHDDRAALRRAAEQASPDEPSERKPTQRGQTPKFATGTIAPKALPHHGAVAGHLNELDKLRRQLRELRRLRHGEPPAPRRPP